MKRIFCFLSMLLFVLSFNAHAQDSLLQLLKSDIEDSVRVEVLIELGDLYVETGSGDEAREAYLEAIILARKANLKTKLSQVLNSKGLLLRRMGEFDLSVNYFQEAEEIAEESGDISMLAQIYNNLGVSYRRMDQDDQALEYHYKSLEAAEKVEDYRLISYAYNSIGIILTYQENYSEALGYFERALKISEEQDNSMGVAINYNSIAWVYEMKEDYDPAIEYYNKALQENVHAGNRKGMAICYHDLGKLYQKKGEYTKALEYYNLTLKINEEDANIYYIARTHINLGEVYGNLGNFQSSISQINLGLESALAINSKRLIQSAYTKLAGTYEGLGQYNYALENYKLASEYKDSIYNEESAKRMAMMRTVFDLGQTEKENLQLEAEKEALNSRFKMLLIIAIVIVLFLAITTYLTIHLLLTRKKLISSRGQVENQNVKLKENEEKLSELILTKDRFFKILAHDLRGNFNGILGFSELLLQQHNTFNDEERSELIGKVYDISTNTFRLLENLLLWAKAQNDDITLQLREYSLKDFFKYNAEASSGICLAKNVSIESRLYEDIMVTADKDMINTVIRNLLSNAVKFSYEGSKVLLRAEENGKVVKVCVEDNGVGLGKKQIENLFKLNEKNTTLGTKREKGSGIGLMLCKELVEEHGGELWVESERDKGAKFFFTLPKSHS